MPTIDNMKESVSHAAKAAGDKASQLKHDAQAKMSGDAINTGKHQMASSFDQAKAQGHMDTAKAHMRTDNRAMGDDSVMDKMKHGAENLATNVRDTFDGAVDKLKEMTGMQSGTDHARSSMHHAGEAAKSGAEHMRNVAHDATRRA